MSDEISMKRSVTHNGRQLFFGNAKGVREGPPSGLDAKSGSQALPMPTNAMYCAVSTVHNINTHGIAQKACAMERVSLAVGRDT